MFSRRELLALTAGLGATTQTRCGKKPEGGPTRPLAVSLSERITLSGTYLAVEKGYFKDAGFDMEISRFSGTQSVPLLAGGRLDVAFGGIGASLINAIAHGQALRVVAGREVANPDCGESFSVFARRAVFDGGPIDPNKLKGKRFAVRKAGISEFVLELFLAEHGMTRADVEAVDLSVREAIVALAEGQIDVILDLEFARSPEAISPEIVRVWSFSDAHPGYQYSFVIFGEQLLEAETAVGARFLAAYLKGGQEFVAGETPQFMLDFAATHGLDLDVTVSECRDTFSKDGSIDIPSLQGLVDWHQSNGRLTQPSTAAELVDTRFIEEARRMLETDSWRV